MKPFNSNLGEDVVQNFIKSMVEESKLCNDVMKNIILKKTCNE